MKMPTSPALRTRRDRAGFSLAELMVVIVILGLLATVVVPNVVGYLGRANNQIAKADLKTIQSAITTFQTYNGGALPESLQQLIDPDENGQRLIDLEELLDPWGNEYEYETDVDGPGTFLVVSYGSDGQPGGEGDAGDISNKDATQRQRKGRR